MSSYILKMIAIAAMFSDHFAKALLPALTAYFFPAHTDTARYISEFMIIFGRFTMPIMAYFIAEGCRRTGNITKYITRLFVFALISQVPFSLAFHYELTFFDFGYLNVMFTLCLGALAVALYETTEKRPVSLLILALITIAAFFLNVDYSFYGVLLIFTAYVMPAKMTRLFTMGALLSLLYLWSMGGLESALDYLRGGYPAWDTFVMVMVFGLGKWLGALAPLVLLYFYNEKRGRRAKYFFYIFYPAHLAALALARELILSRV